MNKYLEKIAASSSSHEPRDGIGARLFKAIGSATVGNIAALPIAAGASAAGMNLIRQVHSPHSNADRGTIKKFMKDNNLRKSVTFNTRAHNLGRESANLSTRGVVMHSDIMNAPGYIHNRKGRGFIAGVKTSKGVINKDVIMHELGHAKDFSRHGKIKHLAMTLGRSRVGKQGLEAASLAALSSDGKARDYAPVIVAVPGAMVLREEGMANYHAYKGIKAHKGGKAANQFLKRVASKNMLNYGLAASIPVVGTYVGKKIMDKWSPRSAKKN